MLVESGCNVDTAHAALSSVIMNVSEREGVAFNDSFWPPRIKAQRELYSFKVTLVDSIEDTVFLNVCYQTVAKIEDSHTSRLSRESARLCLPRTKILNS
jgi:hypothetical protein